MCVVSRLLIPHALAATFSARFAKVFAALIFP